MNSLLLYLLLPFDLLHTALTNFSMSMCSLGRIGGLSRVYLAFPPVHAGIGPCPPLS